MFEDDDAVANMTVTDAAYLAADGQATPATTRPHQISRPLNRNRKKLCRTQADKPSE